MHIYIDAISIVTTNHTQVACICQLLPTPDYNIIFKTLQENYMNDDIDDYYECIWDLALLESLINNLSLRSYEDKKNISDSNM